jgi:hypothetical protein
MRTLGIVFVLGLMASPVAAQGNGRYAQNVPPGQLPPPGLCRVWYDGRPPGQQPGPMNCDAAERIASRDSRARVIYGERRGPVYNDRDRDDRYRDRDRDDRYRDDRRGDRDDRYRNDRGGYRDFAYDNGYRDGLQKGRDDAHDRKAYDPVRQKWYRDASRGYNDRYGAKVQYQNDYRAGFEAGYADAYRNNGGYAAPDVIRRWPR